MGWESDFPNLGKWRQTSKPTPSYNCFAFAVGETDRVWDPFPPTVYYWPDNIPRGYTADDFVRAFSSEGFVRCADGSLVVGKEKIAIYLNKQGTVEHAARQLADGVWTSKLGDGLDIAHETPEALAGDKYGEPRIFMERALNAAARRPVPKD